jgi:hypothetical protein
MNIPDIPRKNRYAILYIMRDSITHLGNHNKEIKKRFMGISGIFMENVLVSLRVHK